MRQNKKIRCIESELANALLQLVNTLFYSSDALFYTSNALFHTVDVLLQGFLVMFLFWTWFLNTSLKLHLLEG